MKEAYNNLQMEIIAFDVEDIITDSQTPLKLDGSQEAEVG